EFEIRALDIVRVAHLADHAHDRWRELLAAIRLDDDLRIVRLHAVELLEEIDVEVGAAAISTRDALHPTPFLPAVPFPVGQFLDLAQPGGIELFACELLARLEQVAWAQEAAD